MDLAPIITRLATAVPTLKAVGGAADFAAAQATQQPQAPVAWVLPLIEQARPSELTNATSQRVQQRFGVIVKVRNVRDSTGAAALDDLHTIRDAIVGALLGWAPDAAREPCEFVGGRLLALENGVIYWQDDYTTAYYRRSV